MKEGGGSRGSNDDDACSVLLPPPDALKLNGAWGSFHRGHSPVPGRTNGPQGPVAICRKALPSLGIVFTDCLLEKKSSLNGL